jgi:hypothetical protein
MSKLQLISSEKAIPATKQSTSYLPSRQLNTRSMNKRKAVVGAALVFTALLVMALAYPPARVAIAQGIEVITFGMITIRVVEPEAISTQEPGTVVENYGIVWTPSTVEEVKTNYPRLAGVPNWAPTGYELQDFVALYFWSMHDEKAWQVLYEWRTTDDRWIQLEIIDNGCPDVYSFEGRDNCGSMYMEMESPSFVTVNNEAALFYERPASRAIFPEPVHQWNAGHYQTEEYGLHLYWQSDQRLYMLSTSSEEVLQEDLIRMLESIP